MPTLLVPVSGLRTGELAMGALPGAVRVAVTTTDGPAMPLGARIAVVVVLLAVAAATLATVLLGRTGRLRRDGRAGVRTPSALASDRAFALANRTAAPFLVIAAVVALVSAVLVGATGLRGAGGLPALIGCGIVIGGLLVLAAARADRAARTVPAPSTLGTRSGGGVSRRGAGPR